MRLPICFASMLGLTLTATVQAGSCFCLADAKGAVYQWDCQHAFNGATPSVECKLAPGPTRQKVTIRPGTEEVPAGKGNCDPCEVMERSIKRAIRYPDDDTAATKGTGHE